MGGDSDWVGKYHILVKSVSGGVKSEFFVVDLKKETIVMKHPAVVWSHENGFESTAVLHEGTLSVLNIGLRKFTKPFMSIDDDDVVVNPEQDYIHSSDSDTCISTLDLTKATWSNWTPGPKMIFDRDLLYRAILDKMIFAFRSTRLNASNPDVYQIIGNDHKWEETTVPFGGPRDPSWISIPPISDPNNNRLIVFFAELDSLYTYRPPPINNWELLRQPLSLGYRFLKAYAVADQVVGDNLILCFYPDEQIFLAYNIVTNKWLDVDWLFKFDDTQQGNVVFGIELVHLGNDILCLVTCPMEDCHIWFFRFSVKLVKEKQLVQLTPLSCHSICVPDFLCSANTYIPF